MTPRFVSSCVVIAAMTILGMSGLCGAADDKALKPLHEWSGSVADEALLKQLPAERYLVNEETFAKMWKAWRANENVPAVDFKKEIVLVETTSGSRLNVTARLTESGDLKVLGMATADFGPGFRYQILVVSREGVKTVNGKALPKE